VSSGFRLKRFPAIGVVRGGCYLETLTCLRPIIGRSGDDRLVHALLHPKAIVRSRLCIGHQRFLAHGQNVGEYCSNDCGWARPKGLDKELDLARR
jgi:hypothetical protein